MDYAQVEIIKFTVLIVHSFFKPINCFKTWFILSVTSIVDILLLSESFPKEHFVSTVEFLAAF